MNSKAVEIANKNLYGLALHSFVIKQQSKIFTWEVISIKSSGGPNNPPAIFKDLVFYHFCLEFNISCV